MAVFLGKYAYSGSEGCRLWTLLRALPTAVNSGLLMLGSREPSRREKRSWARMKIGVEK
jgi:hypothetical protein